MGGTAGTAPEASFKPEDIKHTFNVNQVGGEKQKQTKIIGKIKAIKV